MSAMLALDAAVVVAHSGRCHSGSCSARPRSTRSRAMSMRGRTAPAAAAQRHARGAGQRGQVDDQLGLALGAVGQRVAQDHAAFGVGVADLDVQALARLEHVARAGRHCRRWRSPPPGSAPAAAPAASAPSPAAPGPARARRRPCPSSSAHAVGGLMSRPPLSKHTPLPTRHSFGSLGLAPVQLDQARRARLRAAHGVDGREVLLQQRVAHHLAELGAMRLGQLPARPAPVRPGPCARPAC
jgi:hypothetical protein